VGAVLKDTPAPMINSMFLISAVALVLSVVLYRRRVSTIAQASTPSSSTTSTKTKP
jgi:hypothetical protein